MKPIVNIAREYAERVFTKEFLDSTSDSWYFDALDWFEYTYKVEPDSKEAKEFSEKIQYQFDRHYIMRFGKRDDYYYLKGIIRDMKDMHEKLEIILKHGTLTGHGTTIKDAMKKLTMMQFSLGLVTSAVNRKYNFEKDKND